MPSIKISMISLRFGVSGFFSVLMKFAIVGDSVNVFDGKNRYTIDSVFDLLRF